MDPTRSRKPRGTSCVLLLIALTSFWQPAIASNLTCYPSAPVPVSNFELTDLHKLIVVARVIEFDTTQKFHQHTVTFEVLETVKGGEKNRITIPGRQHVPVLVPVPQSIKGKRIRNIEVDRYETRSPRGDFSKPRIGTENECWKPLFEFGESYLLFLERATGLHQWLSIDQSRTQEALHGMDDPWLKTIRKYKQIQASTQEPEKALMSLKTRYQQDPEYRPLIEDISRHFQTPSILKSVDANQVLFEQQGDLANQEKALWALIALDVDLAASIIKKLIDNDNWTVLSKPVCRFLVDNRRKDYLPVLFEEAISPANFRVGWQTLHAAIELADSSHEQAMLRLLQAHRGNLDAMGQWFVQHPSREARAIYRSAESEGLPDRHALMYHLAGMGDREIVKRAIHAIEHPELPPHESFKGSELEGRNWIVYYLVALSPLRSANRAARRIIKETDEQNLAFLLQGYMKSSKGFRWDRVQEIVDRSDRSSDSTYWLYQFLRRNRNDPRVSDLVEQLGLSIDDHWEAFQAQFR